MRLLLLVFLSGCATQRDFNRHKMVESSIVDAQTTAMVEFSRLWELLEHRIAVLEAKAASCCPAPKDKKNKKVTVEDDEDDQLAGISRVWAL